MPLVSLIKISIYHNWIEQDSGIVKSPFNGCGIITGYCYLKPLFGTPDLFTCNFIATKFDEMYAVVDILLFIFLTMK